MIAKRPIYYTILPSLVIIIGYVWYRRKRNGRVDCDTGGNKNKVEQQQKSCKLLGDNQEVSLYSSNSTTSSAVVAAALNSQQQPSESLPIGTPQLKLKINNHNFNNNNSRKEVEEEGSKQSQSPGSSSAGSSSSSLCKSAPIDIAPNPRSPPKRVTEQEIDCEILKLQPEESDIKNLRYIEEPDLESDYEETPTPADSPPYRARQFKGSSQSSESNEPVIVKGTMEAKISPENSFRERKYTHTESDESNHEDERPMNNDNSNDNGCVMPDDDVEVQEATQKSNAEVVSATQNGTANATQPSQQQIASPSLSMCSMHSGDSGQGSSPPQSVGAATITYDFLVPNYAVGYIIGNRGHSINRIKEKTGANVIIRKGSQGYRKQRVCSIEGTQLEIDAALKMIRQCLPEKRNSPPITLERIFLTPDNQVVPSFNISSLQLKLIEGINNDVSISSVISGGHLFLQQPLHPSYPKLAPLQHRMNTWYTMTNAPELPEIIDNAVCAYCTQNNWYRVQIVSHKTREKTCLIKYLDFGGYSSVHASELRQIHADYMVLPFQAIECVLSNVRPPNGGEWSLEAAETILKFTGNVVLQAQIAGYTDDDVPEVLLYVSISKDNVLSINQELCARKLAEWVSYEDTTPAAAVEQV